MFFGFGWYMGVFKEGLIREVCYYAVWFWIFLFVLVLCLEFFWKEFVTGFYLLFFDFFEGEVSNR